MTNSTAPASTPSLSPTSTPASLPVSSSSSSSSSAAASSSAPATSTPAASSSVASSTPVSTPASSSSPAHTTVTGTPTQSTAVVTSTRVITSSGKGPTTVILTSTKPTTVFPTTHRTRKPHTSTPSPTLVSSNGGSSAGGLSTSSKIAIGVVVPIVVLALLAFLFLFFWRRRKQRREAEEARRKELEDYGYNPNHDPTLPAIGMGSTSPEMLEDTSGYRGWGNNTTVGSNRKASTNLSSGGFVMGASDDERGRSSGGSPGQFTNAGSTDPLMDGAANGGLVAAGGLVPQNSNGAAAAGVSTGVQRGTSNASSQYSATARSEHSADAAQPQDYSYAANYSQYTPYAGAPEPYADAAAQPVIRDVTARRNTKIENPAVYPQQGNSGIAQNF